MENKHVVQCKDQHCQFFGQFHTATPHPAIGDLRVITHSNILHARWTQTVNRPIGYERTK